MPAAMALMRPLLYGDQDNRITHTRNTIPVQVA